MSTAECEIVPMSHYEWMMIHRIAWHCMAFPGHLTITGAATLSFGEETDSVCLGVAPVLSNLYVYKSQYVTVYLSCLHHARYLGRDPLAGAQFIAEASPERRGHELTESSESSVIPMIPIPVVTTCHNGLTRPDPTSVRSIRGFW